ncbi:MAG TPA: glycerophosphodiester phosphodiesterase family protein [Planctomycetota bacterium]|nr:glycerophosphodiester phosphodiesterase family protein [Planctomycetota bacterium]
MATPHLIAHRGHTVVCPENTRASIASALDAGASFVEVDVQLSKDREPFLFHDRTLGRVCGRQGALGDLTAEEVRALRACEAGRFGSRFAEEPVAHLADLVELFARRRDAFAFVEIKRNTLDQHGVRAVLKAILPVLEPIQSRCALISFNLPALLEARRTCALPLGAVFDSFTETRNEVLAALRPEYVFTDLHGLPLSGPLTVPGAQVAVYEVADPAMARSLAARGVRFVETFDYAEMSAALGPATVSTGEARH